MILKINCSYCGHLFEVDVKEKDWKEYNKGKKLIQNCFPYLSASDRELIISKTCERCFDEIFKDDEISF